MKKLLKFAGIGFIVLIVLGLIAGSGDESPDTSNQDATRTTSATKTMEKTETIAGLNEGVTDKNLTFTVLSVDTASTLGNQYLAKDAQGLFHIVKVKIENNGKETVSFDSSMAKIVDDQGREFDRSIDGQSAQGLSDGSVDLFLQQVQPGLSVTGDLVFDLPEGIESAHLVLKGGYFSEGVKVKIK